MRSKMMPFVALAGVLAVLLFASSCGNGSSVCPTCGTTKNGSIVLIDTMLVPEHNANGEPGGPFNIFDISWVDPVNHFYYVTDRIGLDVPMFNTKTDIALAAIGGDNSVAEAGNNASHCLDTLKFGDAVTIPPIITGNGNFTRFGCRSLQFALNGFGNNGHFGGFIGGQCCASRANNLNPLTGPNGLEATPDGTKLFVGNGSSNVLVFDMTQTLKDVAAGTLPPSPPTVIADLVSGTSPDYDGPQSIAPCEASANGRAFSDPTCGDLRGDELATTGATPATDAQGNPHDLLMVINGDPGFPFTTIFDVTGPVRGTGAEPLKHCLPVNPNNPFSPGGQNNTFAGPNPAFPRNYSTCVLGQIYYDGAFQNNQTVAVDDIGNNGPTGGVGISTFPCPDPSVFFFSAGFPAVPSGASGHAAGGGVSVSGKDVPCHHGPILDINTGVYDPTCDPTAANAICQGAIAPAGLGGMVWDPNIVLTAAQGGGKGAFLLTNGNSTGNITIGSVDVINPFFSSAALTALGYPQGIPMIVNSYPTPSCMPSGVVLGPGTDILVTCAGHDGRAFAPATIILNGNTGTILATINNVGGVDQGWFNPGDNHYYLGARDMPTGPVMGVIDAIGRQWLQNVPTQGNTHSVAADSGLNKIFLPLPAGALCRSQQIDGCVGVYAKE